MHDFIVYKRLKLREWVRLPGSWQRRGRAYTKLRKKAERENPPSINVLQVCILQALVSKERTLIDKADELVSGNVPDDVILGLTGEALIYIGCSEEGLSRLHKSVEINGSVENMKRLVCRLKGRENYHEKLRLCNLILQQEPHDVDALNMAAILLTSYGRLEEAHEYIEQVLDVRPKNAGAREILGDILANSEKHEPAIQEYKKALRFDRYRSKYVWPKIAYCYYFLNEVDKAKKSALKALKRAPDDEYARRILDEIDGRRKLGLEYCAIDFNPHALPFLKFEASVEGSPGQATAYLAAMQAIRTKDMKRVQDAIKTIGNNVPRDVVLRITGQAKFNLGREEEGLADIRQAVKLNPTSHNICVLANCLSFNEESEEEAKELFERILSEAPNDYILPALLGLAALVADSEQALNFCRRAIEISPDDWRIHYTKGEELYRLGRFNEACEAYEQARRLTDGNPAKISRSISKCYLGMRSYSEALQNAERALVEDPGLDDGEQLLAEVKAVMQSKDQK